MAQQEERYRVRWTCESCSCRFTSVITLDASVESSLPEPPTCPECEAELSFYHGSQSIEQITDQ